MINEIKMNDVIAKRDIVGYPYRTHEIFEYDDFIAGYVSHMDDDIRLYAISNAVVKQSYYLYVEDKHANELGVIVSDEMVPLLSSMRIKLIPVSHEVFFSELWYSAGFFSPSYVEHLETQSNMALNPTGTSFYNRSRRPVSYTETHIMPRTPAHLSGNYYIAVGLGIRHVKGTNHAFPKIQISNVVKKHEMALKNESYKNLLKKRGNSIMEI